MGEPNITVLQPSRKRPAPGDVFAMFYPSAGYVFGRVIFVNLPHGPMGPGSDLVYIYDQVGKALTDVDEGKFAPTNLLVPPMFVNRLPWSRGYFQNISSRPLSEADVLDVHCFQDLGRPRLLNLKEEEIVERHEPCGVWGLQSYRTIDDLVSKALGLPLAKE